MSQTLLNTATQRVVLNEDGYAAKFIGGDVLATGSVFIGGDVLATGSVDCPAVQHGDAKVDLANGIVYAADGSIYARFSIGADYSGTVDATTTWDADDHKGKLFVASANRTITLPDPADYQGYVIDAIAQDGTHTLELTGGGITTYILDLATGAHTSATLDLGAIRLVANDGKWVVFSKIGDVTFA